MNSPFSAPVVVLLLLGPKSEASRSWVVAEVGLSMFIITPWNYVIKDECAHQKSKKRESPQRQSTINHAS
jgi:hypothetical protein